MKEQVFPIFRVSAQFKELREHGDVVLDEIGFEVMLPIGSTISIAIQEALDWWERYLGSTGSNRDKPALRERLVDGPDITVRFIENETWCSGWFQHSTRNTHLDDASILVSFRNFVQRKKRQNVKNGHLEDEPRYEHSKNPYYCLMGAEDEWRWKICRCEHCQKLGIVTIDH